MSQAYNRFMVAVGIGNNRKLRRLPVAQRWAYVAGVLPLAAQSPLRGALLISDGEPVTAEDVRDEASVTLKDARGALEALRKLEMLQRDHAGVEWVHDWDDYNPDPKPSDSPEATRERKRKQRATERAGRHADVTRDAGVTSHASHAPKGREGKVLPPLTPPPTAGGNGEKTGLRADKTNPRAMAERQRLAESIGALRAPTAELQTLWTTIHGEAQPHVSESVWHSHLRPLKLVALDDAGMVVTGEEPSGEMGARRYSKLFDALAAPHGASVRVATEDEHNALTLRGAA